MVLKIQKMWQIWGLKKSGQLTIYSICAKNAKDKCDEKIQWSEVESGNKFDRVRGLYLEEGVVIWKVPLLAFLSSVKARIPLLGALQVSFCLRIKAFSLHFLTNLGSKVGAWD